MCNMWLRCVLSLCVVLSVCWARDMREVVQADREKGIQHRPRRESNDCSKVYQPNTNSGTVNTLTHDINGTIYYFGNVDCLWRFTNDDGAFIKLTSTNFSVENSDNCEFDYVEITEEGVAGNVRVCGRDPVGYISTGPNVNIRFVTDESYEDAGFNFNFARFETANIDSSKCDSSIIGGPDGLIQNGISETTTDCFYRIQAADAEHVVELELEQLDFGSNVCKDECIYIYDGLTTRNEMGRIDTNSGTGVLNYRANAVFIRYTRGVKAEGERFRIAYKFVEDTFTPAPTLATTSSGVGGQNDCSHLYEDEGEIDYTSPTNQNNKECVIVARNTALHNRVVQIEFVDFELERSDNCTFDYLKVFSSERNDLESLEGSYCNKDLRGKTFIYNSNSLRLEFRTDESIALPGFRAIIKFIPADECECSDGLVCVMKGYEKVCKRGTDCSSTDYCKNRGTCVKANNDQVCYCQTGFIGETCNEGEGGLKILRFSITPKSQNIKRNQEVDAECKVDVDKTEQVEYRWRHDGNLIQPYANGFGYLPNGLLVIDEFNPKMEGTYSCIAKTNSTQAEYAFKYTLIEDCSIHISSSPKDDQKKVGQRVLFECLARNAETITWTKDGKAIDIENDNRIQIKSTYYLRIDNVKKSDEGTYKCIAAGHGCFSYREAELKVSTDKLHKNYCGRSVHDIKKKAKGYISQGFAAEEKMHPWHVNFMTDLQDTSHPDESFCGGTLISQKYVLTAAHCVAGFLDKYPKKTFKGNVKLFIGTNDCTGKNKDDMTIIRRPKDVSMHGRYEFPEFNNDIAIIELSSPVVYSDYIRPICLESAVFTDMMFHDTLQIPHARVVGCGRQNRYTKHSITLKEVYLPYVPQKECVNTMEATGNPVTKTMFCAGEKAANRGDSCPGDSGGSLVMTRDSIPYWVQTGIVSWGIGCDKTGVYGVYTNVAYFHEWITNITKFDEEVVAPFL